MKARSKRVIILAAQQDAYTRGRFATTLNERYGLSASSFVELDDRNL